MDQAAVQTTMQSLYKKARAARQEGKRSLALAFRRGARRLQRSLKADKIKQAHVTRSQKKAEGEG